MDPHAPYYPKREALAAMGAGEMSAFDARYINSNWNRSDLSTRGLEHFRERIVSLYDAGIRWVDTQVERLVAELRGSGRWKDCALALTADHGEEFLEHGGRFHAPSQAGEEILRVPLLIRVPEIEVRPVSDAPLSLLHLGPTLLDAVGVSGAASFQGRSHWAELQSGVAWSGPAIAESVGECTNPFRRQNRFGSRVLVVREGNLKLVLRLADGENELYDLRADGGEKAPLPQSVRKVDRKRLLEAARDHVRTSFAERDLKSALRAELRDLQLDFASAMGGGAPA
jgi:arylsulfatase A-like enzyme